MTISNLMEHSVDTNELPRNFDIDSLQVTPQSVVGSVEKVVAEEALVEAAFVPLPRVEYLRVLQDAKAVVPRGRVAVDLRCARRRGRLAADLALERAVAAALLEEVGKRRELPHSAEDAVLVAALFVIIIIIR